MLKRTLLALLLLLPLAVGAQTVPAGAPTLSCGLEISPENALCLDRLYDFTNTAAQTPPPHGYRLMFIEHYGRHGSRYAYNEIFYSSLHTALQKGAEADNLTDLGRDLKERFDRNYERYLYKTGDLTPLGRAQQYEIARRMYSAFPAAFGKNAVVKASASKSERSIMSMTAFCLGLKSAAPDLSVEAETGRECLPGTNPRDKNNPFPGYGKTTVCPFDETLEQFQDRKLDYRLILSKLFRDADRAEGLGNPRTFVINLYILVSGMNSIPEEERTDFSGLFTAEESALMCEIVNYKCYRVFSTYYKKCFPVVEDIIADAGERIASGQKGATLRFGHDHVLLPVMHIIGLNGHGKPASSPDELPLVFRTWDSCMAANIQMVFYAKGGDVIFKILLNGNEASLDLEGGPYYSWEDFVEKINSSK